MVAAACVATTTVIGLSDEQTVGAAATVAGAVDGDGTAAISPAAASAIAMAVATAAPVDIASPVTADLVMLSASTTDTMTVCNGFSAVGGARDPFRVAVAMVHRFQRWNQLRDATNAAATAVDASAPVAIEAGVARVQYSDAMETDADDGASFDLADEVAHISAACRMLKHTGVEVASVSLLGWTLRYHLRSTFKSGDWYATSPEGGVYRSHKALQRRVTGRKYPVANV